MNIEKAVDTDTIDFIIVISLFNDYKNLYSTINSIRLQRNIQRICIIIIEKPSQSDYINLENFYHDINVVHIYEDDTGIYSAWNKAIKYFNKQWVLFLGAGDLLYDNNTLIQVDKFILENPNAKIIYGNELINNHLNSIPKFLSIIMLKYRMCIPHSATFHNSNIFKNKFNESYKICGDYDLLCRLNLNRKNLFHIDRIITKSMGNGISSQYKKLAYKEYILINIRNQKIIGVIYAVLIYTLKILKDYLKNLLKW